MKLDSMSKNIVAIMNELSTKPALVELLINNDEHLPLLNNATKLKEKITDKVIKDVKSPRSKSSKIKPYPFDVESTTEDGSFIRVYYNDGEFNENEVIAEGQIHIDIVVAKTLWLIDDGVDAMIRPYEIMSRITDAIGTRSVSPVRVRFKGYQHLYVNTKFDAIRLYADYMSIEV